MLSQVYESDWLQENLPHCIRVDLGWLGAKQDRGTLPVSGKGKGFHLPRGDRKRQSHAAEVVVEIV